MGGLLGGVALAFIVENVDNSIRTPQDIETYCGLPSLGVIPSVALNGKNGHKPLARGGERQLILPVTMEQRNSGSAEAFRALRTSLLLSSPGAPPQVILVTSAMMQEGKSFTALNLAVVLAQTGQKVLLVDSDMRRPAVHKYLGLPMNNGLSACLAGTEEPAAVHHHDRRNTRTACRSRRPHAAVSIGDARLRSHAQAPAALARTVPLHHR